MHRAPYTEDSLLCRSAGKPLGVQESSLQEDDLIVHSACQDGAENTKRSWQMFTLSVFITLNPKSTAEVSKNIQNLTKTMTIGLVCRHPQTEYMCMYRVRPH
jgi:hypothetical protein